MLIIEYHKNDFQSTNPQTHFIRTYPTQDDLPGNKAEQNTYISLLHLVNPSAADINQIKLMIAAMQFPDLQVVIQIDRSRNDWKHSFDTIIKLKKYIGLNFTPIYDPKPHDLQSVLERCNQEFNPLDPSIYIEIDPLDMQRMYNSMREPQRSRMLTRIGYYKPQKTSLAFGRARGIQHLNLIKYAKDTLGLPLELSAERSLTEIGPGAGFFYRYAQELGTSEIVVVDKNEGFLTLAAIDQVTHIIDADLVDNDFQIRFNNALPSGTDYCFAKGVLNIYAFDSVEHYKDVLEGITNKINQCAIWINYNIDRQNGPDEAKTQASDNIFSTLGWERIDIPSHFHRLLGINYPHDVHTGFWVLNKAAQSSSKISSSAVLSVT